MQENGSGTVLVLTIIGAVFVVYSVVLTGSRLGLASSRLQTTVDLAAIGASQTLRGLNTGFPCRRAEQILLANMAQLETCSIVGDETTVAGSTSVVGIVLNATATASGD